MGQFVLVILLCDTPTQGGSEIAESAHQLITCADFHLMLLITQRPAPKHIIHPRRARRDHVAFGQHKILSQHLLYFVFQSWIHFITYTDNK